MAHFEPWGLLPILKDLVWLLIPAVGAAWAWFRARQAQSWPSTQGTVMGAQVQRATDSYIQPWLGRLSYSYVVNGEYHAGFHQFRNRTERKAEERIAGWRGRMVVVCHAPNKPEISVLLKSDQPGGQLGN